MNHHHHHQGDEPNDGQVDELDALDDGQAEESGGAPPGPVRGRRIGRRRPGQPWDTLGNSGP